MEKHFLSITDRQGNNYEVPCKSLEDAISKKECCQKEGFIVNLKDGSVCTTFPEFILNVSVLKTAEIAEL